jgi:hypothetical protein
MRLLVDSDAFCKLVVSNLLSDAAALFDAELGDCGRLAALPYMLRRGTLPRTYGVAACERCLPIAQSMPVAADPPEEWLERLAPISAIDPGEAILFAVAADRELPVLSGDLRALRALRDVEGFPEALAGRIVVLEAILLALCQRLGGEAVRERIAPVRQVDTVTRICFSSESRVPEEGLRSYLQEREREFAPLVLWSPRGEGR